MERNYGVDLLKIVSMYMIVFLHILGEGGILENLAINSIEYHVIWIIEIGAYCAVDCYALLSGYVGINTEFKLKNIVSLWIQVFFYSFGITLIMAVWFRGTIGIKTILTSCLPVLFTQYWYFTAYFGLFFFIPIIKKFVMHVQGEERKKIIFTLLLVFAVLPTLVHMDPFKTSVLTHLYLDKLVPYSETDV